MSNLPTDPNIPPAGAPLPGASQDEPVYVRLEETAWEKHGRTIITITVIGLLAVAGYALVTIGKATKTAAAAEAYNKAKVAADYQKVVDQFPDAPVAGDALVQLATRHRDEGKLAEEEAALRRFVTQFPRHPLLPLAQHALGRSLRAQGKGEAALAQFADVRNANPGTGIASMAALDAGKTAIELGRVEDARALYQEAAATQFTSSAAQMAAFELKLLEAKFPKPNPPAATLTTTPAEGEGNQQGTANPSPAPSPAPAAAEAPATAPKPKGSPGS